MFTCTHAHETKAVYENRYVAQFIERAKHFHKYTRQHLLGIINSDLQPKSQTRMTASVLKQDPNTLKGSEERYSFVLFCFVFLSFDGSETLIKINIIGFALHPTNVVVFLRVLRFSHSSPGMPSSFSKVG